MTMSLNKTIPLLSDFSEDQKPSTEGIKYAGSKLRLLPHILALAKKTGAKTVLDGFSGSTRVAQAFAKLGYTVVSNDVAVWSEIFGICYLLNRQEPQTYFGLIEHLNAIPPKDGWFTQHYGGLAYDGNSIQKDGRKRPWQLHNTRKLDAIREEIDALSLSSLEKAVALTSLILAMDRVDSTLGHFVSYLQQWSPRSYNEMTLRIPEIFVNAENNTVLRRDIFDITNIDADLAYFDPPYGSNNEKMPPSRVRYASYYHPWTTICLNDKPPVFGKALRRRDTSDKVAGSVFEEFRRNPQTGRFVAVEAIEKLVQTTRAPWIVLSYSSGGRATAGELYDVLLGSSRLVEVTEVDYRRNVMASMKWTNDWTRDSVEPNRELLFLIEKR